MGLFAAMLTALLLFLMSVSAGHWYLLGLALAAAIGLAVRELRAAEPFVDLRLLGGDMPLLATYGRNLLTYVASYAYLYGFTQWLEAGRGLSASQAGLILPPTFLTAIIVSSATGRRPEVWLKLLVGGVTQVAACGLLLVVSARSPIWLLVAIAALVGIPQGLIGLANQNALYHQADPARMGSSAGLLRTFMYLGAIIAAAATGAFLTPTADKQGLHDLALFMTPVSALMLVAVGVDRSLRWVGSPTASKGTLQAESVP